MYIRPALLAGCFLLAAAQTARARPGGGGPGGQFGLGLMGGEPSGITVQIGVSGPALGIAKLGTAINAAVGLDILNDKDLYVHLDYILLIDRLISASSVTLPFYIGLGGFVVAKNNVGIGARVPFGVQLDFRSAPIHIFAEVVFRLQLVDNVKAGVAGALGFRYFF